MINRTINLLTLLLKLMNKILLNTFGSATAGVAMNLNMPLPHNHQPHSPQPAGVAMNRMDLF
jgi:hypothetical protein